MGDALVSWNPRRSPRLSPFDPFRKPLATSRNRRRPAASRLASSRRNSAISCSSLFQGLTHRRLIVEQDVDPHFRIARGEPGAVLCPAAEGDGAESPIRKALGEGRGDSLGQMAGPGKLPVVRLGVYSHRCRFEGTLPETGDQVRQLRCPGRGRLRRPIESLNCGNSGTTTRLLLGVLAAHQFSSHADRRQLASPRPMRRVTGPLARMGARFIEEVATGFRSPSKARGSPSPTTCRFPVPRSRARCSWPDSPGRWKSRCGSPMAALGTTPSGCSAPSDTRSRSEGWIELRPHWPGRAVRGPGAGRPSSAAFLVGAGVLAEGGELGSPVWALTLPGSASSRSLRRWVLRCGIEKPSDPVRRAGGKTWWCKPEVAERH